MPETHDTGETTAPFSSWLGVPTCSNDKLRSRLTADVLRGAITVSLSQVMVEQGIWAVTGEEAPSLRFQTEKKYRDGESDSRKST